ncbi:hypothetical protein BpHYR1_053319 [Brachionus plicatilis]|uniref:Secreted protein n=1 Tax=Brachionus plicatilis TaxID=10195 RepID=A0A3M7QCD9_BRAPC|nr:hypothetical protein BpHYR1_053319 [Brachionus plicatilis]
MQILIFMFVIYGSLDLNSAKIAKNQEKDFFLVVLQQICSNRLRLDAEQYFLPGNSQKRGCLKIWQFFATRKQKYFGVLTKM